MVSTHEDVKCAVIASPQNVYWHQPGEIAWNSKFLVASSVLLSIFCIQISAHYPQIDVVLLGVNFELLYIMSFTDITDIIA